MTDYSNKDKCRIDSSSTTAEAFSFKRTIPTTVKKDISKAVRKTSNSGNEQSLTWCRIKNTRKIFVSGQAGGTASSTTTKPCMQKNTERIGDMHTHPTNDENTMGLTPSTADVVSTLTDSLEEGIPQISCITGPNTKFINCYQPKPNLLTDQQKIEGYTAAMEYHENSATDIAPYIRDNVARDFDHAVYDRKSLKRVYNPSAKDIVKDSIMKSKEILEKNVENHQKPAFCKSLQDLNYPTNNDSVMVECLRQLGYNKPS